MEKIEGFTEITIPSYTYTSCRFCKYYKTVLLMSGRNPKYSHQCDNSDIPILWQAPIFGGNLPNDDITPHWCPYMEKKINEN